MKLTAVAVPVGDAPAVSPELQPSAAAGPETGRDALAGLRAKAADFVELTKPRVAVMILFTVGAGAVLASGGAPAWPVVLSCVLGTALVAAGSSALNQFLERDTDAGMLRTVTRPIPSGRLLPVEVLVFGLALIAGGLSYLYVTLPRPDAMSAALFTSLSYVLVYTPLKRVTTLNTLVGAVPGAMPPVIGWLAVRGGLSGGVAALFLILFVWQIPHFLAIAWMYREDYARGGLRMLTVHDRTGLMTGRQMIAYCLALVPVSLLPVFLGSAGGCYGCGAIVLGLGFLASAVRFLLERSNRRAKTVLRASLVYLPGLLLLMVLDGWLRRAGAGW